MKEIIRFEVKDWEYPTLEDKASNLAQFIHTHKSFLSDLNTFMRVSSQWWKKDIENSEFQKWISKYIPNPKKAASDRLHFARLLTSVKDICKTPEDWDKMRGIIPEKIFEIYFIKRHETDIKAFGAQVMINEEPVVYYYSNSAGEGRSRRTVDAGSWDGAYGEFVEVKFQPDAFQEQDIGYLRLLEDRLDNEDINHCIYLVTFDQRTPFVRKMLEYRGLLPDSSKFQILGVGDIVVAI